jgi:hypothetical protein
LAAALPFAAEVVRHDSLKDRREVRANNLIVVNVGTLEHGLIEVAPRLDR